MNIKNSKIIIIFEKIYEFFLDIFIKCSKFVFYKLKIYLF